MADSVLSVGGPLGPDDRGLNLRVSRDYLVNVAGGIITLFAAGLIAYETALNLNGYILQGAVGFVLLLILSDVLLTRGLIFLGIRTPTLRASHDGLSAPVRSVNSYRRQGSGLVLHSPLLRRPLHGLAEPNAVSWSKPVVLRIMSPTKKGDDASAVIDFFGGFWALSGLRNTFSDLSIRVGPGQLTNLVGLALTGGAHVHIDPKLLPRWKDALRRCRTDPDSPNPEHSGVCLPPEASNPEICSWLRTKG